MAKWVKSEHPENLSSHHPAFQSRDQSMQRELTEIAPYNHERTTNTADGRQGADGVMQHPGIAPEPGLGSCQPGPKPSLLGSKRSHSSGNRSDDSESGTEQSHHDQRQRRRGNPWSEDEHRNFLAGLKKLGKGDWRGISRHFVQTRTPTQVASHAQKYFIRQLNLHNRKRRSSLFDMAPEPEAAPSSGTGQEAAMFQQSRQGDLLAGGMQGSRGGGPADVHRLKGGGGLHDEGLGYQQWMQGQQQMPAPGAHPAVLQAMLQAAAVGGQCMPPMAAMYMAAAFGGRPPGPPPLQQQGGFGLPPPFGFGGLPGMPSAGGPGALTPQQLAGMSVLLQQQQQQAAAAAAMFPGAYNPLDPSAFAAAMQNHFANAVAANQMLAMQGQMGGQLGLPAGVQLPPPGPAPFGGGPGLYRPPSVGNLSGFSGLGSREAPSQQQQQLTDEGERSFGRLRDAGTASMNGVERGMPSGLPSREQSAQNTDGSTDMRPSRVHRPQPSHARPAYPSNFLREGGFARSGMSELGSAGSEGRQAGASAHDGSMRACPLSDRLGSGGRMSSFRQLAQSPKTSGVEDQGETTGGSGGRSGGEQGPPSKEARSSSCTITTNRQGQQALGDSCVLSAEHRFTPGGSIQSSLQDTQDNSLGTSTQFGVSLNQDLQNVLSPR